MPEEVKSCIRKIYDDFRSESKTYEDLKIKIERYIHSVTYNDELWAAIAKRELEAMLSKEIGSLLLNKLPET